MVLRRVLLAVAVLTVVMLAFVAGFAAYPLVHQNGLAGVPQIGLANTSASAVDMNTYWQVWNLLDQDFYGARPDVQKRTHAAITGMVQSFGDPYTYYEEPEQRELERDKLAGKFGGIGATIETGEEGFILHPLPDQPAAKAGVQDGDVLLQVDGRSVAVSARSSVTATGAVTGTASGTVTDMASGAVADVVTPTLTAENVAALIRGPIGSSVNILVRRPHAGGSQFNFTIERAEIQVPSIDWRLLKDKPETADVGYIRQSIFSERSPDEMQNAIEQLLQQGAHRFVWDLRGNPGGLVSSAVAEADMWLESGVILIEEKNDGTRKTYEATKGALAGSAPIDIVVDGGSASASEIVAGALRDNGRAHLVGQKTYGKGSVQLIHELPDQSSLHVTTAQWLTPKGVHISGQGINPDVTVANGQDALQAAVADLLPASQAMR